MDKLLYINTVPDIRIREMVSTTGADGIPSGWTVETANN